jgi:hypothetical protein
MTRRKNSFERSLVLVGISAVVGLALGCDSHKTGGSTNAGGTAAEGGNAGGSARATGGAGAVAAGGATSLGIGGTAGSGAGNGNVPLDELVAGFVAAQCGMFVRCGLASDLSYCATTQVPLGRMDRLTAEVSSVKAGKARYDGYKARACLNAVAELGCDEFWSGSTGAINTSCQGTFSDGTVADGEACRSKVECHQGSYCRLKADPCIGTCVGVVSGGCQDDVDCPSGQVCESFWPAEGKCVDPTPPGATAGSRCGTYKSCVPGFYCSFSNGCQPQGKEGELCDGWLGSCGAGLVCMGTSVSPNKCRKYAAKGEPCQAPDQCGALLYSTIKCDMSTNICVDKPGDGSCFNYSASFLAANGCDPFTSYCDDSTSTATCAPYKSVGAPCAHQGQCGLSATCASDPDTGTQSCVAKTTCAP